MIQFCSMDASFSRNIGSLDDEQQQWLLTSSVAVIGCGGLGGFVIEELARLGVGRLILCDPDRFTLSNRNRQLLAGDDTMGRFKARVAAERVLTIQRRVQPVVLVDRFAGRESEIFPRVQVVVDCLDSITDRRQLAASCRQYRVPLVHGAVERWYGQVAVQPPDSGLLLDVLPPADSANRTPSVLVFTVATVASIQAAEVCKLLLGIDSPLYNRWMSIDLKMMRFEILPPVTAG